MDYLGLVAPALAGLAVVGRDADIFVVDLPQLLQLAVGGVPDVVTVLDLEEQQCSRGTIAV